MLLKDLPAGTRFILLRTGEEYRRLITKNEKHYLVNVHHYSKRRMTTLNHQCHVKPLYENTV